MTCLIAIVIVVVITGIAICYFKYSDYDIKSEDDLLKVAQSINSENAERTGQFGENINWYYRKGVMVVNGEGEFDYAYRLEKDNQYDDLRIKVKWLVINEGITKLARASYRSQSIVFTLFTSFATFSSLLQLLVILKKGDICF